MKEKDEEKLLDLLSGKTFSNLEGDELLELQQLEKESPEVAKISKSFELTAVAIQLADLDISEPLPDNLKAKILLEAEKFFGEEQSKQHQQIQNETKVAIDEEKRIPLFGWLGWAVAGVACIALAVNLYLTHFQNPQSTTVSQSSTQTQPKPPSLAEEREKLLSLPDTIMLQWHSPSNPKQILGDLVWNNSAQKGFVRFYNLPANDPSKETYQLWIVDESQKYPIDGGLFNVNTQGEIILPIDTRLKVEKPKMFAVTAEKPGGVVVSDLKRVMAVAKIET